MTATSTTTPTLSTWAMRLDMVLAHALRHELPEPQNAEINLHNGIELQVDSPAALVQWAMALDAIITHHQDHIHTAEGTFLEAPVTVWYVGRTS